MFGQRAETDSDNPGGPPQNTRKKKDDMKIEGPGRLDGVITSRERKGVHRSSISKGKQFPNNRRRSQRPQHGKQ